MRSPRLWLPALCGVAALTTVGCASAFPGAPSFLVAAAVFFLSTLLSLPWRPRSARAGEEAPCDGDETTLCRPNGRIARECCPKHSKCNFMNPAWIKCQQAYYCTIGHDPGRCPAPQPYVTEARDEKSCAGQGEWAAACVERKLVKACIMPVHTNYTGPGHNPTFRTCGPAREKRCTTHDFVEDCYPRRGEIGDAACSGAWAGGWTKVCLGGKVAERCLPRGAARAQFPSLQYIGCGPAADTCAVGDDKTACN